MNNKKVQLIMGSTRPNRIAPHIADFITKYGKEAGLDIEIIDLRDWDLPFFNEDYSPASGKPRKHDHSKKWAAKIAEGDAYIFLSSEYNFGYPAPLKNAIDYLHEEWKGKPALLATYGFFKGKHAAEGMHNVMNYLKVVKVQPDIALGITHGHITPEATIANPVPDFEKDKEVVAGVKASLQALASALDTPTNQE